MARARPKHCRICGRHESVAGHVSARGKCADCGDSRIIENNAGMIVKHGPAWRNWRRAMAACVGGELLDERSEQV